MNVICIEEEAFFQLIDKIIVYIDKKSPEQNDKWISSEEAMRRLRIRSKTTLQRLRDEGKIRFSQPSKRNILYDVDSLYNYLEKYSKEVF